MRPGGCCLMDLQALAAGYSWKQPILSDPELLSPFRDWVTVPCGGQVPVQRAQVPSGKWKPRTAEWGAFTWVMVAPISLSFRLLDWESAPSRGRLALSWRGHPQPCSHPGFRRVHFLHKTWLGHSSHQVLWEWREEDLSRATSAGAAMGGETALEWQQVMASEPHPSQVLCEPSCSTFPKWNIPEKSQKQHQMYRCCPPVGVLVTFVFSSSCF